jgi:hypothetical protein
MAVVWDDSTEDLMRKHGPVPVYTSPPLAKLDWVLVKATNRKHVAVYRPTGEWTLVVLVPMSMPTDLWLELVRPYLSADEARIVEQSIYQTEGT